MNATAVGLMTGLKTKKVAARACLENYLHVLDTNAPINRMEGNFDQAQLESKSAQDVRRALSILRQAKAAGMTPPAGYMGMTHQQYMPQYQRRVEFTPEEQELIRRNKGNVIPKIFTSQADSPAVDMASPVWSGVGGALGGAALGAGVMAGTESPRAMGIGATAGGVLGAVVAAMARKAQNASIEENMRRLPPGAVRRDYEADPVYQAAQERDARIRAARLAGGAAGGAHKFASATEPGMDPLKATATGAGLGAAMGGALSFGDMGMMGRGALAGGSAGYLASAVDRIVAKRQQRQRMEKPARFGLNTYTPLDGTGAAGNIVASIANVIARIKGKAPALRWQAHQVSSEVPTLGGAAIGGLLGGLSRGRETRDVVEDAPDGRKIRRPVTTERTIGDRVGGAIAGAGIGAVAGNVAARGYVAGTPPEWAGWLTRK